VVVIEETSSTSRAEWESNVRCDQMITLTQCLEAYANEKSVTNILAIAHLVKIDHEGMLQDKELSIFMQVTDSCKAMLSTEAMCDEVGQRVQEGLDRHADLVARTSAKGTPSPAELEARKAKEQRIQALRKQVAADRRKVEVLKLQLPLEDVDSSSGLRRCRLLSLDQVAQAEAVSQLSKECHEAELQLKDLRFAKERKKEDLEDLQAELHDVKEDLKLEKEMLSKVPVVQETNDEQPSEEMQAKISSQRAATDRAVKELKHAKRNWPLIQRHLADLRSKKRRLADL